MRCRIGDIAYLVGPCMPENAGVLVEVLRLERAGVWWVRSLSGPRPADDGTTRLEAQARDSSLRPIVPPRKGKVARATGKTAAQLVLLE